MVSDLLLASYLTRCVVADELEPSVTILDYRPGKPVLAFDCRRPCQNHKGLRCPSSLSI